MQHQGPELSNIGAKIITYTVVGVPYYITAPKTLFKVLRPPY